MAENSALVVAEAAERGRAAERGGHVVPSFRRASRRLSPAPVGAFSTRIGPDVRWPAADAATGSFLTLSQT
ncbi:MAG: hypothetical protein M3O15_00510 [Acidobacteriota bacterium]|nr:hypothetical protein [Acidobacteriota bacterium]